MHESVNRGKKWSIYEILLQTYIPTLILKCEPKSGLSCRRQMVISQTPQGESVAKPETPLLIILSITCKWGPWQHAQSVIWKVKSVAKNILGRWLKIETASQTLKSIHNQQRLSTSGIWQPVPGKGMPHILKCYVRYQGSKYTVVYIYTRTNYHKYPSQRGNTLSISQVSVPIPLPVVKGQTTVPAPWESISSHPPRSGCRHLTMPATTNALRYILVWRNYLPYFHQT